MHATPYTTPDHDLAIARWKAPHTPDALAPGSEAATTHPAGDVLLDAVGGLVDLPKTTWACATLVSSQLSCSGCDTSLWHGSCYASSIGCCPA